MKKNFSISIMLVIIFSLVGCTRSLNDIIENEPNFAGIVAEVHENYIYDGTLLEINH